MQNQMIEKSRWSVVSLIESVFFAAPIFLSRCLGARHDKLQDELDVAMKECKYLENFVIVQQEHIELLEKRNKELERRIK